MARPSRSVRVAEAVADAPDALDGFGRAGVAEAFAQVAGVVVDGAWRGGAPDAADEVVFGEDAGGVAGEAREEVVLQLAEVHGPAVDVDGARGGVDVDGADVQVAAGDVVDRAAGDGGDDGAHDEVVGVGGEVVV